MPEYVLGRVARQADAYATYSSASLRARPHPATAVPTAAGAVGGAAAQRPGARISPFERATSKGAVIGPSELLSAG